MLPAGTVMQYTEYLQAGVVGFGHLTGTFPGRLTDPARWPPPGPRGGPAGDGVAREQAGGA